MDMILTGRRLTAEEARAASPIERVAPGFPPTLLLHGTADEVVPSRASQQLYEALTAVGTTAELRLYSGQRHEFVSRFTTAMVLMHCMAST